MTNVIHVVLVYQREEGRLLLQETYADSPDAMRRQFALEQVPEYADMEIVVLSADSIETLHETHGRYFYTLAELAQQLKDAVEAAA
ncbi:MAG TPA: hypothetical protein VHX38_12555 [Pseudonocardiaceae bacterium]|jgi:hypothetical protein|nr:hypothetical protein [Pseudonocardiaceae bacterium]